MLIRLCRKDDVAVAFVSMPQTNYPVVVLEHTDAISSVTCSGTTLDLTFNNTAGFQVAQGNWTLQQFVMISYSPDCGSAAASGQRDFILVNNIAFSASNLTASASISYIDFNQTVGASNPVTVDLGTFSPGSANGTAGFNVTSASAGTSGTASGNGTSSGNGTQSADFDVALDDAIGYLDVDDPAYEAQLLPGTNFTESDLAGDDDGPILTADPERRSLRRRGWFDSVITGTISAGKKVGGALKSAGGVVSGAITAVAATATKGAAEVFDKLNPYTAHTYTPIDSSINIATPVGSDPTPWGTGKQLYSQTANGGSIAVYCVGCGVSGTIQVKGTVTFSIAKGITAGGLSANGPISAALELGIVASYANTWNFQQAIGAVPLSPLTIAGIITVGPQVSLAAGGSLTVNANGQLLAGAILDWPAISANIDLANIGSSSASGFTSPKVNPVFQAQGSVSATAEAYLLLNVEFAIDILQGTIKKSIALVEKPDVSITAAVSGTAGIAGTTLSGGFTGPCAGVAVNVAFTNYLYADILGLTQKSINTWNGPSYAKCIPITKSAKLRRRQVGATSVYRRQTTYPETNSTSAVTNSTVDYTVIDSTDGVMEMHYADNGNLYAVGANSSTSSGVDDTILFAAVNGSIIGDSDGRLFHGYVDTLASLGVSRFRLADGDHIPVTSVML